MNQGDDDKERLYVADFMDEEEEKDDFQKPLPVKRNKDEFERKKTTFKIEKVVEDFILK